MVEGGKALHEMKVYDAGVFPLPLTSSHQPLMVPQRKRKSDEPS